MHYLHVWIHQFTPGLILFTTIYTYTIIHTRIILPFNFWNMIMCIGFFNNILCIILSPAIASRRVLCISIIVNNNTCIDNHSWYVNNLYIPSQTLHFRGHFGWNLYYTAQIKYTFSGLCYFNINYIWSLVTEICAQPTFLYGNI